MLSWPEVTDENVAEFVGFYVDERKKQGDTAITIEKILAEFEVHTPYVLLEHMVFCVVFDFASEEWMETLRDEYQIEAKKSGRTVVYSHSGSDQGDNQNTKQTTDEGNKFNKV